MGEEEEDDGALGGRAVFNSSSSSLVRTVVVDSGASSPNPRAPLLAPGLRRRAAVDRRCHPPPFCSHAPRLSYSPGGYSPGGYSPGGYSPGGRMGELACKRFAEATSVRPSCSRCSVGSDCTEARPWSASRWVSSSSGCSVHRCSACCRRSRCCRLSRCCHASHCDTVACSSSHRLRRASARSSACDFSIHMRAVMCCSRSTHCCSATRLRRASGHE